MEWRTGQSALALGALGLGLVLSGSGTALAQFGGASTGSTTGMATGGGTVGLNANPFMNPYANPFINPYMAAYGMQSQSQMAPGNAALYFFAAQQMSGGIGSGRLSGTRPGPTAMKP